MPVDPLKQQLYQLAHRLRSHDIPLIVGGGYGLLLKAKYIRELGERTRVDQLPIARSTGDVDLFLTASVIIDANSTDAIRSALDDLGYLPVPGAEYYQFYRDVEFGGTIRKTKFDFLSAPISGPDQALVKMDKRRIRPRKGTGLHAHTTPEAATIESNLQRVVIDGEEEDVAVF